MEPLRITAVHSQSWDALEIANHTYSFYPFEEKSTRSQFYQEQLDLWRQDRTQPQDNFEQELFGRSWRMPHFKRGFCILRSANGNDAVHINNHPGNCGDFITELHAETCQIHAKNLKALLAINNNLLHALDGMSPPDGQDLPPDPLLPHPSYKQWPRRVDTQAKVYFNRPPTAADFQRLADDGRTISIAACRMKKSPVPRSQAEDLPEDFNPVPVPRTNREGLLQSMTWECGKGGGHSIVMYDKFTEMWNKDKTPTPSEFFRDTALMCDINSPEWPKFNACRHTFMAKMQNWPPSEIDRFKRDGIWDEDPFWVIEYRLRTPTLKAIGCPDMRSLFYANHNGSLWRYCTEKILRILEPDPNDSNKARWDTAAWWKQIQQITPLTGPRLERVRLTRPLLIDKLIRAKKAMAEAEAIGALDGLSCQQVYEHSQRLLWWSAKDSKYKGAKEHRQESFLRYQAMEAKDQQYANWVASAPQSVPPLVTITLPRTTTPPPVASDQQVPPVPQHTSPPPQDTPSIAMKAAPDSKNRGTIDNDYTDGYEPNTEVSAPALASENSPTVFSQAMLSSSQRQPSTRVVLAEFWPEQYDNGPPKPADPPD